MKFQRFVPLLSTLVVAALFFLYQPPSVSSVEKVIAQLMCPTGEFVIGLKQRYYWWKERRYSGGVGIGNLSVFCSSPDGGNADREGKKPNHEWAFQGDPLQGIKDYYGAVVYNKTWEQICEKPMEMSGVIKLTKVSLYHGEKEAAVAEHLILNCCSGSKQREDLVKDYEEFFPIKQCSNATVLAGVCGILISYDDGIYQDGYKDIRWGVKAVFPVCCEVGSGLVV